MPDCSKCKTAIRGETGVRCVGVCNREYHCTVKCSGIDQYSAKVLESNNYVRFICDDCLQYIQNVDLVLKDIQDDVNKNKQNLKEYKHEFKMSLKENESEMKLLLEAIEKRYEERLKKIDSAQKLFEKYAQEIKKVCENMNQFENKNTEICNKIEENNKEMCKDLKKAVTEINNKQNKMSYAEAVQRKTVIPDANKQIPLIIKPKEKQNVEKRKEELNKKVNPVNLKITNVENRRNGALVIQSENKEEREKIKTAIQNELSDNYEIKVPNPTEFYIDITDISFKYSEQEIIEKIKKQNPIINYSEIKVIKTYEYRKNNRTIYNVRIRTDNESYTKVMNAQKLNIGWERCRAFDGTDVKRCFKCKGFNHLANECKNLEMCVKCHGNHKSKECAKDPVNKCINCIKVNQKLNMGLDENHGTYSKECPVYQNKLRMKKKRMGLSF